jgi:hypothetical protein
MDNTADFAIILLNCLLLVYRNLGDQEEELFGPGQEDQSDQSGH